MIKIKINASDEIREVTFSRHSEHVIELGGIADAQQQALRRGAWTA